MNYIISRFHIYHSADPAGKAAWTEEETATLRVSAFLRNIPSQNRVCYLLTLIDMDVRGVR